MAALTDSIIAYYSFDTANSGLTDNSTKGRNLTAHNGAVWGIANCKIGKCYTFDGNNDYLDRSMGTTLKFSDWNFSFCMWVIPQSIKANYAGLFQLKEDDGVDFFIVEEKDFSPQRESFVIRGAGVTRQEWFDSQMPQNKMSFLCGVWTNTQQIIYYNGTVNKTQATSSTTVSLLHDTKLGIGFRDVDIIAYFKGVIDEFGLWNRTLSLAEIQQLYNNGAGYNPFDVAAPGAPPAPALPNATLRIATKLIEEQPILFMNNETIDLHNLLNGIQGGKANQYYHINVTSYNWILGVTGDTFPLGNKTCNDLICSLGDDTGYRFTALSFTGTTGFSDLSDADTTCASVICSLSDDTGYRYTALDFTSTSGLSDGIDNNTVYNAVNVSLMMAYRANQSTRICSTGNYSYGYYLNGTPKCRSDVSGSGGGENTWTGNQSHYYNKTYVYNKTEISSLYQTIVDYYSNSHINSLITGNLTLANDYTDNNINGNTTALTLYVNIVVGNNATSVNDSWKANATAQLTLINGKLPITDQRYNETLKIRWLNLTKAAKGNCAAGQLIQNVTNSTVQCKIDSANNNSAYVRYIGSISNLTMGTKNISARKINTTRLVSSVICIDVNCKGNITKNSTAIIYSFID